MDDLKPCECIELQVEKAIRRLVATFRDNEPPCAEDFAQSPIASYNLQTLIFIIMALLVAFITYFIMSRPNWNRNADKEFKNRNALDQDQPLPPPASVDK